eukprot:gene4466-15339_t
MDVPPPSSGLRREDVQSYKRFQTQASAELSLRWHKGILTALRNRQARETTLAFLRMRCNLMYLLKPTVVAARRQLRDAKRERNDVPSTGDSASVHYPLE